MRSANPSGGSIQTGTLISYSDSGPVPVDRRYGQIRSKTTQMTCNGLAYNPLIRADKSLG